MSNDALIEKLRPVIDRLGQLDFADPETENIMNSEYPIDGAVIQEVVTLSKQGLADGWLCDRENRGAKFSRIAKPSDSTANFSIDAVLMSGKAMQHTHTKGEMSLCIPMEGSPKFDSFEKEWALYPPGSTHVPTVTGGQMLFIYFLPDGAVEWK